MAPLMQKAIVVPEPKQPWKLVTDWPVPSPGPKDVLIKIVSAALNPADWKVQYYAPPFITEYPFIGGLDGAGFVEEVGAEVTNVSKGDRVVLQLPDNLSFDEAASIPLGLNTVLAGIWAHHPQASSVDLAAPWEEGGLTKYAGQPAFVVGGSSSVGQFAIQIAKLQGFSPIITTSSLKHTDYLKSLGAAHVVDRSLPSETILAELPKLTGGKPIKYAYNTIGGTPHTTWPTMHLPLAVARDKEAGLAPIKIAKPFASLRLPGNLALGVEVYKRLTEWLITGVVVPNRVEVLPGGLAAVPDGCDRLREDKVSGVKLIVRPQETV
ncbi:GroES-like protein [Daedaleopsis nitida]|nr:GroES-like protein [Daedaleopsis nitida]